MKKRAQPHTQCKAVAHVWDAVGPVVNGRRPRKLSFGTLITFRCVNCTALRYDVVSRLTGQLLWRNYDLPNDYPHERRTKADWRAEWMDEIDKALLKELKE